MIIEINRCPSDGVNGENGTDGINGTDGEDGVNGENGVNGNDGEGCNLLVLKSFFLEKMFVCKMEICIFAAYLFI